MNCFSSNIFYYDLNTNILLHLKGKLLQFSFLKYTLLKNKLFIAIPIFFFNFILLLPIESFTSFWVESESVTLKPGLGKVKEQMTSMCFTEQRKKTYKFNFQGSATEKQIEI